MPPENEPKKRDSNLAFGMLDLGGGEESPELDTGEAPTDPEPIPARQPTPASSPAIRPPQTAEAVPVVKMPRRRPEPQPEEPEEPVSHAREIKIGLLLLGILLVIAATVFGIIKWRENVAAREQAEINKLNQQSRDSLIDHATKKENPAP